MKFYAFVLLACFSALQVKGQALAGGAGVCKTTGDPDNILSMQTQNQEYGCSIAFDTVNSVVYVYDATAPMGSRWEVYAPSGSGGGIWQVQNSTSLAADNTSNNYHRGSIGIGDFSSTTIGASFHLYSPNMTMRLSDSCSTDQCATPLLEFYRGRNTSLLGRVGYLSSADKDFSFINNLAAGKLKFGTDATVKLELLASGQARLNQYTSRQRLFDHGFWHGRQHFFCRPVGYAGQLYGAERAVCARECHRKRAGICCRTGPAPSLG
jgi:hypothetical protein